LPQIAEPYRESGDLLGLAMAMASSKGHHPKLIGSLAEGGPRPPHRANPHRANPPPSASQAGPQPRGSEVAAEVSKRERAQSQCASAPLEASEWRMNPGTLLVMMRIIERLKGVRRGDTLLKPEVVHVPEMSSMHFRAPGLGTGNPVGLYKGLSDKELATLKDIFVWDPTIFCHGSVKRIPCGDESCEGLCTDKGWHPNSCIKVVDIDDYLHLVSKRWQCERCQRSFNAYDKGVLDKLPPDVAHLLPFVIRPSHAITQRVMDLINTGGSRPGFAFGGVAELLKEMHFDKFYRARRHYNYRQLQKRYKWKERVGEAPGSAAERVDVHREMRGEPPADWHAGAPAGETRGGAGVMGQFARPKEPEIVPFGCFDDPDGWNGRDPPLSSEVITNRFVEDFMRRERFLTSYLASTTGRVLCWDHTYELARKAKINNRSAHAALFSVLNEYNQVLACKFVQGEDMAEAGEVLEEVKHRLQALGVEEVDSVYSDRCCQDKGLISELFPHLDGIGLDLFHAIQRLTRCVRKKDQIFFSKVAGMIARCFTDIVKEDLDKLTEFIRTSPKEEHVDMRTGEGWESRLGTSRYARDKCRLAVCKPDEIKRRLDEVIKFMRKVDDDAEAKWREEVYEPWLEERSECEEDNTSVPPEPVPPRKKLTDEFQHAVRTLCDKHLECLQDPKPVEEMYYVRPGPSCTGLPRYGCLRGSSQQEGLHSYLESLVLASHTSEVLMHAVVISGCVRWNEKMRVTHRDVGEEAPLNSINLDVLHDINACEEELFGDEAFRGRLPVPAIVPNLPQQTWGMGVSCKDANKFAPTEWAVHTTIGHVVQLVKEIEEDRTGTPDIRDAGEVAEEGRPESPESPGPREGGRLGGLSQASSLPGGHRGVGVGGAAAASKRCEASRPQKSRKPLLTAAQRLAAGAGLCRSNADNVIMTADILDRAADFYETTNEPALRGGHTLMARDTPAVDIAAVQTATGAPPGPRRGGVVASRDGGRDTAPAGRPPKRPRGNACPVPRAMLGGGNFTANQIAAHTGLQVDGSDLQALDRFSKKHEAAREFLKRLRDVNPHWSVDELTQAYNTKVAVVKDDGSLATFDGAPLLAKAAVLAFLKDETRWAQYCKDTSTEARQLQRDTTRHALNHPRSGVGVSLFPSGEVFTAPPGVMSGVPPQNQYATRGAGRKGRTNPAAAVDEGPQALLDAVAGRETARSVPGSGLDVPGPKETLCGWCRQPKDRGHRQSWKAVCGPQLKLCANSLTGSARLSAISDRKAELRRQGLLGEDGWTVRTAAPPRGGKSHRRAARPPPSP